MMTHANQLFDQGKSAEAELRFREALAIRKKVSGNEDPLVAVLLSGLGTALNRQDKLTDAETMYRECLTIREKKLPDMWYTFYTQTLLGGSLFAQKKYADAEPLLISGYEGINHRQDQLSAGKSQLKEALRRLVQLYEETNRPDEAAKWKQKLAELEQPKSEQSK